MFRRRGLDLRSPALRNKWGCVGLLLKCKQYERRWQQGNTDRTNLYINRQKKKGNIKKTVWMFEYSLLNIRVCMCVWLTWMLWWMSILCETKSKNVRILTNVYVLLCRCMQGAEILCRCMQGAEILCRCMQGAEILESILYNYMCRLTLHFTRHEDGNVFLRAGCSPTLVVCLYRDVTKCLRPYACVRLEHVQPEGRTRKESSRRIYSRPCYLSWAMCR